MTSTHILVVDDDSDLCQSVSDYLTSHDFTVEAAEDGAAMRRLYAARRPDLVILDLSLPGENGLSLARWLRSQGQVAIVMLTGSIDTVDRVVGLETGADDYIAKAFVPRELLARVRAVLRRVDSKDQQQTADVASPSDQRVRVGTKWLDIAAHELVDDDGFLHPLTSVEFRLLKVFVDNPGRLLSRDHLFSLTDTADQQAFGRAIDVRITRLRKKIEPNVQKPRFIRTVRGVGYRFVPDGNA